MEPHVTLDIAAGDQRLNHGRRGRRPIQGKTAVEPAALVALIQAKRLTSCESRQSALFAATNKCRELSRETFRDELILIFRKLLADRGYNRNRFRTALLERGITLCIPSTGSCIIALRYDKVLYY